MDKPPSYLKAKPSFWSGFARLFDFFGTLDDGIKRNILNKSDVEAMNEDWDMVARDFNAAVRRQHNESN